VSLRRELREPWLVGSLEIFAEKRKLHAYLRQKPIYL
jgi:hypothetical protein